MSVVELQGLTKHYGSVHAVENLDLRVDTGEIFGFLGPNGAGKSTTINMMLDFVKPTSGQARIFDMDPREEGTKIRQRIGVLPEGYHVYERLSGLDHLEFVIESKEADDDPQQLLEYVGLAGDGDRKAGEYSKGMAQRLTLAMALVGDPDLLILDEPTTGLDPNGARQVREIIREENSRGTTIFFSSHILSQVEAVCTRVGILGDGRLIADDTIEGLRANVTGGETLVVLGTGFTDSVLDQVYEHPGVESIDVRQPEAEVAFGVSSDVNKTEILNTLEEAGATVSDFSTEEASLDDLFAAYTQGGARA
jgi:ABC-2 type transport system ATP-binding protein